MVAKDTKSKDPKGTTAAETLEVPVEGKELATRETASLATTGSDVTGEESQISLPRLVVLQQMSAEVARPEDPLKSGLIYNRLTKEAYGTRIEVIPFAFFGTRIVLNPEEGLVCRSTNMVEAQMKGGLTADGQPTDDCTVCVKKLWPNDRERETGTTLQGKLATSGPECSVVSNYFALLVNGDDPSYYEFVVLQFMRTSRKAAQDLNGLWAGSRQPLPAFRYYLATRPAKNKAGQPYYIAEIGRVLKKDGDKNVPIRTSEVELKAVKEQSEFMKGKIKLEDLSQTADEENLGEDGKVADAAATAQKLGI